jgi:phosphoglycerol transferase MdoB-like AlkP superfamily enzyme
MSVKENLLSALRGLHAKGNIYLALFYRMALAMVLFSICRIGFYVFNLDLFPNISAGTLITLLLGGLRFDLTALIYTNALVILLMIIPFEFRFTNIYQRICSILFYVCNGVALAANVADFIYYPFTGRRTTADVFQQFENETNLSGLFFRFLIDYWYALVFWMALVALMVWLHRKIKIEGPQLKNKIAFYGFGLLAIPLIGFLLVGGTRGGYKHSTRPITLVDAGQYVKEPGQVNIVLNTPFAIYRTLGKTKIKRVKYFSDDEVEKIYSPVIQVASDSAVLSKKNVVVIILESFSREFFGFYNRHRENGTYKGYTPFLDSLIRQSRTFEYSFATGRKSIDALPSVVASIPQMGVPYTLTPFSGNPINSLGSILKQEGYDASFFHGAPNGSMGFESFMNIAGIDQYYGLNEYGNDADFDGMWGIWDDKFMSFMADTQNGFQEPFVSVFFSVSSHHPFAIPTEFEGKFKGGSEPILRCIQYTDYALKKYFEKIAQLRWYKNTLFVITADHVSSNVLFKDGYSLRDRYSIPILFFDPSGEIKPGLDSLIASQIDIMPTVLASLGYPKKFVSFGRDVLNDKTKPRTWNVTDDVYNFYQGDYILRFDGTKSIGLFNFKTDPPLQNNLLGQEAELASSMETQIKAIIQQYNNRMIDKKFTVPR